MEQHRQSLHRTLRILAFAVWLGIVLLAIVFRREFTLENVLGYTPANPLPAVLVLMLLFALKSLTVVFYSGILYAVCGLLFPLPLAILLSVCGTLVMSLVSYSLARGLGAAHADALREKHPKLRELEAVRRRNSFAFVVVLRCINIVNFDIGSMYCGAVRLPLAAFLAGSLLGKLTDIVMFSFTGASLEKRDPIPILIALVIDLSIALVVTLWSKKQSFKEV